MQKHSFLKARIAAIVITTVMACTLIFSGVMIKHSSANADTGSETETEYTTVEVVSYEDILENYYTMACSGIEADGYSVPFTIEQFSDGYYANDYDIKTYTAYVVEYIAELNSMYGEATVAEIFSEISTLSSSSSSSDDDTGFCDGDASYILYSVTDYSCTPKSEFFRAPVYTGYEDKTFDYSQLQSGDIVFETDTVFFDIGHTAIIVDVAHDSEYGSYIQTIEATASGVKYGFLDDNRMVRYGVKILRAVDTTKVRRNDVVYFANMQLGKPYSLRPFELMTDIFSPYWYCSEMVYAAYNFAGIDVGVRYTSDGGDYTMNLGCWPQDIYFSYNTYEISTSGDAYLNVQLVYGSEWTVRVFNNTGADRTVYYNSKMCFESDAKEWKNLSDEKDVTVSSGGSATFQISTNWFATNIAICYIDGKTRYITYAHDLSCSTSDAMASKYYTLTICYSTVDVKST